MIVRLPAFDLIMTEDWRIQAAATLAQDLPAAYPGGPSFQAGAKVVLTSVVETTAGGIAFPVPSAVALALSIAVKSAARADRARRSFSADPLPGPDGAVHLLRSA